MIDATTLSPLAARPLADDERHFIGGERLQWSTRETLCWAAAVAAALPSKRNDVLAIRSSSASFVAAAVLAAWQQGVDPLILDPNLKAEPESVRRRFPTMVTISDQNGDDGAIHVTEPGPEPLAANWPDDEQTAVLFLTSGSTGEPKVIRKLARQLYRQLERELTWLGVDQGVRVLSLVPPFHILGFIYGLLLPLLARGEAAFLHGAAPARWIDHIHRQTPDLVVGVPSHYRFLTNSIDDSLPNALYMSSGSPLSPAVNEAFTERTGQTLTQVYGSTETGGLARRQGFGAWQPFPGLEWEVRPEDGRLQVRSSWQDDAALWTITDDLVKISDGGFTLLGRADSIVKVGGKRFSTNEVIQQALGLTEVENAVAVVYERFGENAVALYVTATGDISDVSDSGVRSALGQRLAPFKVPRTIRVLANLPTLSNGKVDLGCLRAMAAG